MFDIRPYFIQYWSSSEPLWSIEVRLWLTYGLLMWTGAVWRSESVHLGELVRVHIIQNFTDRGAKRKNNLIWANFSHAIYLNLNWITESLKQCKETSLDLFWTYSLAKVYILTNIRFYLQKRMQVHLFFLLPQRSTFVSF